MRQTECLPAPAHERVDRCSHAHSRCSHAHLSGLGSARSFILSFLLLHVRTCPDDPPALPPPTRFTLSSQSFRLKFLEVNQETNKLVVSNRRAVVEDQVK